MELFHLIAFNYYRLSDRTCKEMPCAQSLIELALGQKWHGLSFCQIEIRLCRPGIQIPITNHSRRSVVENAALVQRSYESGLSASRLAQQEGVAVNMCFIRASSSFKVR